MKPSIQDQLAMVWRTENPNYIILIKNKAGKEMDFSQFKTIEEKPVVEKRKKEASYKMVITQIFGGTEDNPKILISIIKIENNREVTRLETKESKREIWLEKLKKDYKPLVYETT